MESFGSSVGSFQDLVTSPLGGSIFITSAPSSAKKVATEGPAKTVDRSITFKFSNGLCISNIYHFTITNV